VLTSPRRAQGTISSQKQEILFTQFGINYNNLDPMFRKGSMVIWEDEPAQDPVRPLSLPRSSSPIGS